ncbi:MAG: PilZ domain-containing protein [Terriglobia bacterium]
MDEEHGAEPVINSDYTFNSSVAIHRVTNQTGVAQRAERFAIELPIRYREIGTAAWHEGKTVNISMSGVLFRATQALHPRTGVEVALTLPVVISGLAPAKIECRGTVVRHGRVAGADKSLVLAASILRYRFEPRRHNTVHDNGGLTAT